ncbi:4-hydroxy-3-methylbut-2-enyl diphosphate reductase [Candidatus Pantoea edessiphila]|uniref:4-hydroxy-3-methylbut-2-enyl diphosphate reductase n=1 Tax=Candidatus Pantoea edessiphila TaxID=2044610 RepID=A0A2P5T245_9GAMM|nr:4-hydroxy-3-methylbut-2-enyl diphosphate reductase [Candidatus Pantoea edessiphila]PPI88633.1 4-hydroxy-3-methylbut-2-enyl diphosphate reductase [Candidatus Pantoea edessiphila]
MKILLANPRGFCAGVTRAITIVERALDIYGPPVYVYNEIVHNSYIVSNLRELGVIFVKQINEVPIHAVLIFSAHGVSQKIRNEAKKNNPRVLLDATCPLVSKIHFEVKNASRKGIEVILIGNYNHQEVQGTLGQYDNDHGGIYVINSIEDKSKLKIKNEKKVNFMTQSTLSVDYTAKIVNKLRQNFPLINGPHKEDICYATTNRQKAVKVLARYTELILVVGSKNSSNSNRLVEVVQNMGKVVKLIDSYKDIKKNWFKNINYVGVTSGASAPDILVNKVVEYLIKLGGNNITELIGEKEKFVFNLPNKLI